MVRMTTNTWEPDTCGCRVRYEFDADLPAAQRVISYLAMERTCPYHNGRGLVGQAVYTNMLDENQRKNIFHKETSAVLPTFTYEEYMGTGTGNVLWSFDSNGALVVTMPARFTTQQKDQIQAIADARFGVGKVIIL